jgi:hypothetical protein
MPPELMTDWRSTISAWSLFRNRAAISPVWELSDFSPASAGGNVVRSVLVLP